ncbi:DUF4145 domain-containing protein [Vibrio parahaemolyticus]|nr:DUF4145 domain-containing protein [Vibrio parahaemolyticus]
MGLTWKVKVKNLLVISCGEDSQHYKEFFAVSEPNQFDTPWDIFKRQKAVLNASRDDFQNGYLTSIRSLVQADIFDTELEQATELLKSGYKLAAAVIAGVVLETSLRDLCTQNNLPIGKLDKMNSDLAKAGLYNKLQQKRITAIADIRNSAAHGKPEEFTESDVRSMISDIGGFLGSHLA